MLFFIIRRNLIKGPKVEFPQGPKVEFPQGPKVEFPKIFKKWKIPPSYYEDEVCLNERNFE